MLRSHRFRAFTVCLFLSGCATTHSFDSESQPDGAPSASAGTHAVIVTEETLSADAGLTVLEAIRRAMPRIRISGWSSSQCPILMLRGQDTIRGDPSPSVYVDGVRVMDTCVLTTLQSIAVSRIEIYPTGVTPRAGYEHSGRGLILIFMKRAGGGSR